MRNRPPVILVALLLLIALGVGLWVVVRSDGGDAPQINVAQTGDSESSVGETGSRSRNSKRRGSSTEGDAGEDPTARTTPKGSGNIQEGDDPDGFAERDPSNPFRNAEEGPPTEVLKATISGRVIDNSGRGVPDATVYANHSYSATLPLRFNRSRDGSSFGVASAGDSAVATSDASGYYTATLSLNVRKGANSVNLELSASSDGFTCAKETEVRGVLPDDTRANIDIHMVPAGSVTGRVVDTMGQPVQGVFVHATPPLKDRARGFNLQLDSRFQAKTNADGVYQFQALMSGEWQVRVITPDYRQESGPASISVTVGVETRVTQDIVVALLTTIKIKILDERGQPITNPPAGEDGRVRYSIRATATFSGGGDSMKRSARPDADGTCVFRGVPDNATQMVVHITGYRESAPIYIRPMSGQELDAGECRLAKN